MTSTFFSEKTLGTVFLSDSKLQKFLHIGIVFKEIQIDITSTVCFHAQRKIPMKPTTIANIKYFPETSP